MSDLTIRHRGDIHNGFPAVGRCVWCGETCWTKADTPFRPDIGQVPLHLFCGADMREAYKAWRDGLPLLPSQVAGMRRISMEPSHLATQP